MTSAGADSAVDCAAPSYFDSADAIRSRYGQVFAQYPENHAALLHRIVVGTTVIDHEDVARTVGGERFQVAAIYTMRDGKIARIDFVR